MYNQLRNLVFGLDEFEKTKIDIRFGLISNLISPLKINKIEDFEVIEECIYKIKEQLRVKSSNLNKTLANPANKLRKKDVLYVLERLDLIKYDFLKCAFSIMDQGSMHHEEIRQSPIIEEKKTKPEILVEKFNGLIMKNENYSIKLENGKIPFLLIDFKTQPDYTLLKILSSLIYEIFKSGGTNLIIEKNKALIIPRYFEDNLFEIPRIEVDLDDIHSQIITKLDKSRDKKENDGFIEIKEKPTLNKRSKKDDLSLDALLENKEKPDFMPSPNPNKDDEKIIIEPDESIRIEKKEKEIAQPEVEIEYKKIKENSEKYKKFTPKEENNKVSESIEQYPFEVYRDDKIVAYFEKNSKAKGELIVKPINGNSMKSLNESDLSYMFIFAKVFSSLLFEIEQAHGTNILIDYENGGLKIVPRYQDDNLPLKWNPKQESEGFLDQIKDRLIKKMHNELETSSQEKPKTVEKVEGEIVSTSHMDEQKSEKKAAVKEKVEHLLESLHRIP